MKRNYISKEELAAIPKGERQAYLEEKKAAALAAERWEKNLRAWAQQVWDGARFERGNESPENLKQTALRLFVFGFCRGSGSSLEPASLPLGKLELLHRELRLLQEARGFLPPDPTPPDEGDPRFVIS